MVPGPGVGGVLLQPGDGFLSGFHQCDLDLIGARVQRGGLILLAALAGLAGGDPVGGVQHRHALDRADGQIEIRHLRRVFAALGRADLGQLHRAGERMRGEVRRLGSSFPFGGRPGAAARSWASSPPGPMLCWYKRPIALGSTWPLRAC